MYSQEHERSGIIKRLTNELSLEDTSTYFRETNMDSYDGTLYLRIWTNKQVINIWIADSSEAFPESINLELYNWAKEEIEDLDDSSEFIYQNLELYFSETAKKVLHLIDSIGLTDIPSYHEINGWKTKGLHDKFLVIESKVDGDYYIKTYPSYDLNKTIDLGSKISRLLSGLNEIMTLESNFSEFVKEIPVECYSNIESGTWCKALSKKEKRKLKKARKNYHQ